MKKLYFLMIALLAVTVSSFAQGTYYWSGASGGNWQTASNWRTNPNGTGGTRGAVNANDILIIDQGSTISITNVPSQTVGNLRVLSGNVTLLGASGSQTFAFNNQTGADLRVAEGATLIIHSSLEALTFNSGATAEIAGTLITNSTFNLAGTNVSATVTSTGTLSVSGNGAVSNASATRLIVDGIYSHDRQGGTVPTATWATGSRTMLTVMSNSLPGGLGQNFGSLYISGNVTDAVDMNANFSTKSDFVFGTSGNSYVRLNNSNTNRTFTIGRNFIINSGNMTTNLGNGTATIQVDGDFEMKAGNFNLRAGNGNAQMTVNGLFSLTGGTMNLSQTNASGVITLNGDFNQAGGTITESGSANGVILFSGNGIKTYTRTAGAISNNIAVTINSDTKVDFGSSVLNNTDGSFTLNSGAGIITSHAEGLRSTGNAGTIRSNTRSYNGGAHYEFRGATTGNFTLAGGANTTFSGSVTINNASGVAASRAFTISGSLILENGYLTTGNNNIELTTSGTVTSNNGAFVYASATGTMRKQIGSTNTAFEFPVGAPSVGLRPVRIQSANTGSGTSTFSAYYVRGNASTVGATLGSGVARVSPCEYWNVTRPSGTRSASVRIGWVPASNCANGDYVTNLSALLAARYTGAQWVNAGGSVDLPASTTTAGTITIPSSSNFGFFALASSNITDNPLPVLFDGVKAYSKNGGVQLEWSNLTERDVIRYEVERSANGIDFYPVNQQAPKSNRDDKASYDFFDAAPIDGANFYRIRVDEIGGKPVYSKILRVEMGSTKVGFSMYPNPVVGRQLTVSLSGLRQGQYSLDVYNTAGQRVYSTRINNVGAGVTQMIELPASIKTGAYVTVITGDSYRESKQFIVK